MGANIFSRATRLTAFALTGGAIVAACGGGDGGTNGGQGGFAATNGSGGAGAGAGAGGINPGTGGAAAGPATGGFGAGLIDAPTGQGGGGGLDPDAACASSVFQGEQVPLDMFIMMDKSGSMSNQNKWDAIKTAFTGFVNDPTSDGIGVGIQFFPPDVALPTCFGAPPCPPGCDPFIFTCVPGQGGSCDLNDYLPPAVTIQELPGSRMLLINAMNAKMPGGGTPTSAALASALQSTTAWAAQFPGRKVITVLATDGSPTECDTNIGNIAALAATAAAGSPPVQTFVIGIGNVANLDAIAMAGGTGNALIVNPATAAQDFLDAMNAIRGQALGCDFGIDAQGPNGETVDFGKVNVLFTPPGATMEETIFNVGDAASCDPSVGGWYYDDPINPTLIQMCPTSCSRLTTEQGTVNIQLGCSTVTLPPR